MSEVLEEKDEYARTLEQAGYLKPEGATEEPAAETADASASKVEATTPVADANDASASTTTATTTTKPAAETQTTTAAADDEPFPGFKALPAEAQAAAKARLDALSAKASEFENRWKAQHGQLAPTQRELEQARRQLRTMSEKLQRGGGAAQVPAEAPKIDDDFRKNYPDEARVFDQLSSFFTNQLRAVQEQNEELRGELHGVSSTVQHSRETATLAQRHPDWQEIDNSDAFKDWLKDIPESKRTLLTSSKAGDVADLIDDYKRDLALAQYIVKQESNKQTTATTTTTASAATTKAPEADPNPTQRQSTRVDTNAGLSEADGYVATLLAAGYKV
jgi:uncharacterized coiled-coil protein SlyX